MRSKWAAAGRMSSTAPGGVRQPRARPLGRAHLLAKPGLPPHVTQAYAEEVFWLAIDPGTYRSLTLGRGLSPAGFETWIGNYYDKMLLA